MRTTSTLRATLLAALATAVFSAHADTSRTGESFYGSPTAATASAHQVTLSTRAALDVDYGSVVTFTDDGRNFTWQQRHGQPCGRHRQDRLTGLSDQATDHPCGAGSVPSGH